MFFQVLTTPGDQTRKIYERLRSGMEGLEKEISSTNTMEHEVADYYKSGLGKDFLEEKYSDFIQDFMAISGRLDFTARVVEILRENYLTQLHQQMHTEFLGTKQYAFFEEPPTWTIIFDGKRIPNLTGKGFQYIHFLISRPREQFSVFDLAKLTDEHEVVQASTVDHGVDKDQDEDETYFHEENGERSEDHQHLQSLRIELAFIEDQLQGVSGYSGPHVDKDKLESDKQFIEKEINRVKSCIRYGEKQDGENSENTRLKNRITKRIERAVKDIRKANPKAADHFERALRPINSYEQRYNLNENIRWYLE
jgi:hypothetical protein